MVILSYHLTVLLFHGCQHVLMNILKISIKALQVILILQISMINIFNKYKIFNGLILFVYISTILL